jgi:sugar lactone lactonase YvrE
MSLCALTLVNPILFGQAPSLAAQAVKPIISLVHDEAPAVDLMGQKESGASLPGTPDNFRQFSAVRIGEPAVAERLTLQFSAATKLTRIKSTRDFVVDSGSTCSEGKAFKKDDTCVLYVRFEPQGPGRRLGKLTIENTATATPMAFGLGGTGYMPVVSFTPAAITTVAGTYPSSKGLLSGAQNLVIDGGDTLDIADTGNGLLRSIDSSGAITSLATGYAGIDGVAVDTFGQIYFDVPSANAMYEIYDYGPIVQASGTGTTSCPASTPCTLSSEALSAPGEMSMDAYNHLFFVDGHSGAAFSTVQPNPANLIFLYDPFPYQQNPPAAMAADSGDNLYSLWANGSVCEIVQQSLYNAENSAVSFNKIAGGHTCGFAGDGGVAGNAEIGSTIGQIAFDAAGNLYFSDTNNQRVRRVDYNTGVISTIAGNGAKGYTGDGNNGPSAELSNPTGVGVDSQGQVYIISSAATGQVVRKLTTQGLEAFNTYLVGTTAPTKIVTVSNTGNTTMVLTNAVFTGPNPGDFSIDTTTTSCVLTPGATLASGQSCKIGISFKPTGAGARFAYLVLNDNTVTNSNSIYLIGGGTSVTLAPTSLAFGSEPVGSTTATQGVTLTNVGTTTLTISSVAITGTNATSYVLTNACGATLAAGANCVIHVAFKPTTTGSLPATLSITDNGGNSPQTVPLTGTGTAAAVKKSAVTINSSTNPVTTCESVTLIAGVATTSGALPTGEIDFMDGTSKLGTAKMVDAKAQLSIIPIKSGTMTLTANYSGDSTHAAGTSPVFKLEVAAQTRVGASCGVK